MAPNHSLSAKNLQIIGRLVGVLLVGATGLGFFASTEAAALYTPTSEISPITNTPQLSITSYSLDAQADGFLSQLAQDTWNYLSSDWATDHHLPWSWRSTSIIGGDYANTAEIGFYALSWLAAYDMEETWSPTWSATESEVSAVLDQLRAWQTGSQPEQPHGANAYNTSVFYQWYWVSWSPPVVGDSSGLNHLVPSIDNAWLAASLITIREYAEIHGHTTLAQKADAILNDMNFSLWYHTDTHRFNWGGIEDPKGGSQADYYSNENRIINFVARAVGDLDTDEFALSLAALTQSSGTYDDITVEKMAYDGSFFTYAGPALFIREMLSPYGKNTINPATQAQIQYAQNNNYQAWGLSDCYDIEDGNYLQQGAQPAALGSTEDQAGLISPHASTLALITDYSTEAMANLQYISNNYNCAYDDTYGFLDSVVANDTSANDKKCSYRFSALNQEWIFLSLANHLDGFVWEYFYKDEGVKTAHAEMYDPTVFSITRIDNSPTSLSSVDYTVVFSEPVTGVDISDFSLTKTGSITGYSITGVSGSGSTYTVTVATGKYNGTLRLDVNSSGTGIEDLVGNDLNGGFTSGDFYTLRKIYTKILRSQANYDGWVLESGEFTNKGGIKNNLGKVLQVGDNAQDKQYRVILSFGTAGIPDYAVITKVILKVKRAGVVGKNPMFSHNGLVVDIKKGKFFTLPALQINDFQAKPGKFKVGKFAKSLYSGWYRSVLYKVANSYINKKGRTQLRLRFLLDDDNDNVADILKLYSGNAVLANRPRLIVKYYVP